MGKVNIYMPDASEEEKTRVLEDVLDMARKYRFSADEYFYLHFPEMPEEERATYVSDLNRIDFCEELNRYGNLPIFDDKIRSYETFGRFYGRKCCCVKSRNAVADFCRFVQEHDEFILKPLAGSSGSGVEIIRIDPAQDRREQAKKLVDSHFDACGGFIVEELIVQIPEMARFNPGSVNTVRAVTIRFDEGVELIAAILRTGRKGSIVDNTSVGGVSGSIDIETGCIFAAGDKRGGRYTAHPDSGAQMVGFVIPRWAELKELLKELAMVVPSNRYTGWDLALTEKGWVMVEGNARAQFGWQATMRKGWRKEMNEALKRLGKPEMVKMGIDC